jgi:wyosine [tRNA(Phe)-imidazoG37] synthetase (radical SAM superfamily)
VFRSTGLARAPGARRAAGVEAGSPPIVITFGPVPSRRLGRSLGINNIPPKACSYSCVYCQVGPTRAAEIVPRAFYPPGEILRSVVERLEALAQQGEPVDWLTFVPDGEPSLDASLGQTIELLRPLGIPIAVISNASLVWRAEVRATLARADWLSLKVDTVDPALWRRVNRPHPQLDLAAILEGIRRLAESYRGTLATETLLVAGMNDGAASVSAVADYLATLAPAVAYLAAPIRPPAEPEIRPPDEATLAAAFERMSARLPRVEYLIRDEGDAFAATGEVEDDLLAITAVHPLREEALRTLLAKAGADWRVVDRLLATGALRVVDYEGRRFYRRSVPTR